MGVYELVRVSGFVPIRKGKGKVTRMLHATARTGARPSAKSASQFAVE
jgi:hypothetical protein